MVQLHGHDLMLKLTVCIHRRASEQISAVFCLWRRHARQQRRNERLASQRLHMVRQQQLVGVMSVWRHHTAAKQKSKAVAARCHRTHAVHLLQNGLQAFRVVTEVKKTRKQMVQHFHCTTQVELLVMCTATMSSMHWKGMHACSLVWRPHQMYRKS